MNACSGAVSASRPTTTNQPNMCEIRARANARNDEMHILRRGGSHQFGSIKNCMRSPRRTVVVERLDPFAIGTGGKCVRQMCLPESVVSISPINLLEWLNKYQLQLFSQHFVPLRCSYIHDMGMFGCNDTHQMLQTKMLYIRCLHLLYIRWYIWIENVIFEYVHTVKATVG